MRSRRRTLILVLTLFIVIIGTFGTLAWQYRWYRLPVYTDNPSTELPTPLMSPEEYQLTVHEQPYVLELSSLTGALCFIGCTHTRDPDDPQIELIERKWEAFAPTVALCESRLGFFIGGLDHGVEMFSEPAAVFALARRDDIPIWSLEPSFTSEIAYQRSMFEPWQLSMFYALRPYVHRIKEIDDKTEPELILSSMLYNWTNIDGLRDVIPDAYVFDSLWRENLPQLPDWRTLADTLLWPG